MVCVTMDMAKILSVSFCCGRAIFDCGFSAELIFGVYRRIDQLDDSVEHEHDARNGDHDTEQFTEGEHETDDDRESSQNDIYDILFGSAKLADQSDDTLESDENTENENNDFCQNPTEYDNGKTDDQADSTAGPIIFEKIENAENEKDHARNGHCEAQRLIAENNKKNADDDIEQG